MDDMHSPSATIIGVGLALLVLLRTLNAHRRYRARIQAHMQEHLRTRKTLHYDAAEGQ